jgi:hypothetical protein
MGNKYKQAYIELSRYFDDLQDLARMGAKYGYIEVVLNSLDSVASLVFNDVSSYPSSNFGTARSEFAEIVRATYQCAISTGSINIMAHLEDKYKVTIGDIADMTDLRFICDTVDAKSVDYLINKYGIVWPRNQIYIFAVASGDLDLMDLLVDNGVALPIFYPKMLISAIISGSIPMFERVLELYDHRPINYDIMTHITNCSRINTKDRMAVYEKLLNKLNDTDYYRFMEQFVDNIVLNYSSNRLLLYLLEKGHYMPIKPIKRLVSNLKQRVRYWEEEGKSAEVSEANELIVKLTNS